MKLINLIQAKQSQVGPKLNCIKGNLINTVQSGLDLIRLGKKMPF